MKNYVLVLSVFILGMLCLAMPQPVFAQTGPSGFVALAPIPGLTDISPTSTVNSATLTVFFNSLYKYLIGLAAILAVIEIIWGGLEISTKDSVSKQSDGRERITQAIFGLILVLSPVLVFSIINPSILNLSLNLPPINLGNTPPTNTTPANDSTTVPPIDPNAQNAGTGDCVDLQTGAPC